MSIFASDTLSVSSRIQVRIAVMSGLAPRLDDSDIRLGRERLDALYHQWNKAECIMPDPLETLSAYPNIADREVAGLLAASMAYGRVNALLKPLRRILSIVGISPRDYVCHRSQRRIELDLEGIVHRFARPRHFAALLAGAGAALRRCGSLEAAFLEGYRLRPNSVSDGRNRVRVDGAEQFAPIQADPKRPKQGELLRDGGFETNRIHRARGNVLRGLSALVSEVNKGGRGQTGYLLPLPGRGSACKRLLLYLRWMVRLDNVDPGGWLAVDRADLLIPLDTWTYRIAVRAGWSKRKSVDMKTVREVSAALSSINPEDPVKYDFALSRFGIRSNLNLDLLFTHAEKWAGARIFGSK